MTGTALPSATSRDLPGLDLCGECAIPLPWLERFNYLCSREEAQKTQENLYFEPFVHFCGFGFN
jgi:hypothetical protein